MRVSANSLGSSRRPSRLLPPQPTECLPLQPAASLDSLLPEWLLRPQGAPYLTTAQAAALAGIQPAGAAASEQRAPAAGKLLLQQQHQQQQEQQQEQEQPAVGWGALLQVSTNPWILLEFVCLGLLQLVAATIAITLPQALPEKIPTWQVGQAPLTSTPKLSTSSWQRGGCLMASVCQQWRWRRLWASLLAGAV
jgi:hypothetical protein